MQDYLSLLGEKFPTRKSEEAKADFRRYIIKEAKALDYEAKTETLDNKHNNIIIGDPEKSKVIFTAHYDTPAASLFPNIMMPRNLILGLLYQFGYPLLLAAVSFGIAILLWKVLSFEYDAVPVIFIILYFGSYFLCSRTFTNKNNLNDNTSGVAAILALMEHNKESDVAFILFDNEEKGKLGSKAYSKAHADILTDKPVINLDCVGNGENIIFVSKSKAQRLNEYKALKQAVTANESYSVYFYSEKGSMSNSDWKNFPCGISVMACKKAPLVGFYTPRIHTVYDTVASRENIEFIADKLTDFIKNI